MKIKLAFTVLSFLLKSLLSGDQAGFVTAADQDRLEEENEDEREVYISKKCAAVLLVFGATAGAGVTYVFTPFAACTAGFCSVGVAKGSAAAWWQSTLPLVAKGSTFAQLQALAMGGVGMGKVTIAGVPFGAAMAASYIKDFCSRIDDAEPDSPMGKTASAAVSTVEAASKAGATVGQTIGYLQNECVNSKTCASMVEFGATLAADTSEKVRTLTSELKKKWDESANSETYSKVVDFGSTVSTEANEKISTLTSELKKKWESW
eukprot:CAMPEP_0178754448 /NCGR_PEP_ID=MMETSP0744-20121128/12163_1 /TAXON_ID=913974 /ORGANISM="Nitzschia punctata, Strain CCMP561" /LENGTH=262 /DNA_ID=CAMNT_0020408357 /DNA_START=66 /DNA_END=851 /DNA_ORIENTATION=-